MDCQVSVVGLYRPPPNSPQTIISVPVQTAVSPVVHEGELVVEIGCQVSVVGLYRPPPNSPQTIISVPVQTAVSPVVHEGAFVMEISAQVPVPRSGLVVKE